MTETEYWNRHLRKHLLPKVNYVWKIAASYVAGIPDWYASGSNCDIWIENKRISRDGKVPSMLDLTDPENYLTMNQQAWLIGRHNEGRNVGVVVFSKEGHVFLPELTWQQPISRLKYLDQAMDGKNLAAHLAEIIGEKVLH